MPSGTLNFICFWGDYFSVEILLFWVYSFDWKWDIWLFGNNFVNDFFCEVGNILGNTFEEANECKLEFLLKLL